MNEGNGSFGLLEVGKMTDGLEGRRTLNVYGHVDWATQRQLPPHFTPSRPTTESPPAAMHPGTGQMTLNATDVGTLACISTVDGMHSPLRCLIKE